VCRRYLPRQHNCHFPACQYRFSIPLNLHRIPGQAAEIRPHYCLGIHYVAADILLPTIFAGPPRFHRCFCRFTLPGPALAAPTSTRPITPCQPGGTGGAAHRTATCRRAWLWSQATTSRTLASAAGGVAAAESARDPPPRAPAQEERP